MPTDKQHGNKKLNIKERKLGQHKVWGFYYPHTDLIEIDPNQPPKQYLYVLIHELTHKAFPDANEDAVERASKIIAKGVWQQNFRRVLK